MAPGNTNKFFASTTWLVLNADNSLISLINESFIPISTFFKFPSIKHNPFLTIKSKDSDILELLTIL